MFKKLFYASASILMLAIAYHLGAGTAKGQVGSMVSGFTAHSVSTNPAGPVGGTFAVMTPNGDIYVHEMYAGSGSYGLEYVGNFWTAPTPAARQTWGQLKSDYRK
jgi:hypothetical protein